ncbi:MAG: hypothetical protein ABFC88_12955 [Thermoguttaceae bacterium]
MEQVTDLADPRRCKGSSADGQCLNVAADGSDYCLGCGGVDHGPARRLRRYYLAQADVELKLALTAEGDDLKSLREEIRLVRRMVIETLNAAKTDIEKINAYSKVNTFLLTLERLMKTCHQLDQSMGSLIAKPALIRLAKRLCEIVVNGMDGVPDYERRCDEMLPQIIQAVEEINNNDKTMPESE